MRRSINAIVAVVLLCCGVLVGAPVWSATSVSDTLSVVKDDQPGVDNSEITVLVSEATPFTGDAVMISRDDEFADALASGLLQRNGPMFTVPTGGPIPDRVRERIQELGPQRAIILGGEAAVSADVAAELQQLNLSVDRLSGGSRFDTAVAIAEAEAPQADTILLARAFPSPASTDETQAFADTLAAGGVAARNGWPVLLTQTEELTGPTAQYLQRSGASRVMVLGGTAAISEATVNQVRQIVPDVQRVAGATRFETAAALEKATGAQDASETTQVILVEGTSTPAFTQGEALAPDAWAAGFASANRAAVFDAPILLTAAGTLPAPTAEFLAPGVSGDPATAPLLTCVMPGPACEAGRQAAGLPPAVAVQADPDRGTLTPGQQVLITFEPQVSEFSVDGSCVGSSQVNPDGSVAVSVLDPLPETAECEIVISGIPLSDETSQTETFTYSTGGSTDPGETGQITLAGNTSVCALGVDPDLGRFYAVDCNGEAAIQRYDLSGNSVGPPVPVSTGMTNDVDLDVITSPGRVNGIAVEPGQILLVDGEVEAGAAVLTPDGSVVVAPHDLPETGTTVGVAWDRTATIHAFAELSWETDQISLIDGTNAATGVLPVVPEGAGLTWDVFFGDIEIACDGHLFLVSSSQPTVLELTASGDVVALHEIQGEDPSTRGAHSSLAIDDGTGRAWIGLNNSSTILQVDGLTDSRC